MRRIRKTFSMRAVSELGRYMRGVHHLPPIRISGTLLSNGQNTRVDCWFLCSMVLIGRCPGPKSGLWVPFGSCVCNGPYGSDKRFARLYQKLQGVCTFDEFVQAYEHTKYTSFSPLRVSNSKFALRFLPYREEFLKTTQTMNLSAWHLKQFVFDDLEDDELDCDLVPISPVMAEYGFEHCETLEDIEGLKAVYRVLLKHTSCQPPAIHQACIEGRQIFTSMSRAWSG